MLLLNRRRTLRRHGRAESATLEFFELDSLIECHARLALNFGNQGHRGFVRIGIGEPFPQDSDEPGERQTDFAMGFDFRSLCHEGISV